MSNTEKPNKTFHSTKTKDERQHQSIFGLTNKQIQQIGDNYEQLVNEAKQRSDLLDKQCPHNFDWNNRRLCLDKKCELQNECVKEGEIKRDARKENTVNDLDSFFEPAPADESEEWRLYIQDREFRADILGKSIMEDYHFKSLYDTGEIYIYDSKSGVWQTDKAEAIIRSEVQKRLGSKWKNHYGNEIVEYIRNANRISRDKFKPPENLINLKNGTLDVLTKEYVPQHLPSHYFTTQIPVDFDIDAECPNFDQFLADVLPDENDREGILELIGYTFQRNYPIQKAWIFNGEGNNGKSTLIKVHQSLIGKENCVSRSLHDLERDRFSTSDLHNKLLNCQADLSPKGLRYASNFKALTGGDLLTAQRKFHHPFQFYNFAKLVFSCNRIPQVDDPTPAFYRRWIIINFPNKFEGNDADPNILKKLTTPEELSGLLNKAVYSLGKLFERERFINDRPTEYWKELFIKKSDSVKAFLQDEVKLAENETDSITNDVLYNTYCIYCGNNDYSIESKIEFGRQISQKLAEVFGRDIMKKRDTMNKARQWVWKGIRFSDDYEGQQTL